MRRRHPPTPDVRSAKRVEGNRLHPMEERYKLGSLGDLVELLIDGWQIEHLHYADRCGQASGGSPAGAFIELTRPDQGRYGLYIQDDGRAFSHRALVALFRESPHIWK